MPNHVLEKREKRRKKASQVFKIGSSSSSVALYINVCYLCKGNSSGQKLAIGLDIRWEMVEFSQTFIDFECLLLTSVVFNVQTKQAFQNFFPIGR